MLKLTNFDGVTRIDSARTIAGRGRYWTTAYLVGDVLIDSGCAHTAVDFSAAVKTARLAHLVNTHSHEDHFGANAVIRRQHPGMTVLAHPLATPVLARPRELQPLQFYRRLMWGYPEASQSQSVRDGEEIAAAAGRFRVIYTPGHSPDHLCLYEPERQWLFTGDLFSGGKDRAMRPDFAIRQIIASLRLIAALPIVRLFPGSARVRDNPTTELLAKISYFEEIGEKVLEFHRRGWQAGAIARAVFGGPMPIEFITGGHFSRRNFVDSYLPR